MGGRPGSGRLGVVAASHASLVKASEESHALALAMRDLAADLLVGSVQEELRLAHGYVRIELQPERAVVSRVGARLALGGTS